MSAKDQPQILHPGWLQPTKTASYDARWKPLEGGWWTGWKATCGDSRCPGLLGSFVLYDRHNYSELQIAYAEMAGSTRRPETMGWRNDLHLVIAHAMAQPACLSTHDDANYRAWVLVPFLPQDPDAEDVWIGPRPIYLGYADTGYRISPTGGGRRWKKEARRSGRRAINERNDEEKRRLRHLPEFKQLPLGESPTLPCTIWCRSCDALNTLHLPDGASPLPSACEAL